MKVMFVSDIHGSEFYLDQVLEKMEQEQPDQLVLLGDLLYHGPRNPLPKQYQPANVATKLNKLKNKIIAVQGNCDSTVDQMVLDFPITGPFAWIFTGKQRIFATHGHEFNEKNMPPLSSGDVLIHGHTHIPVTKKVNDIYLLNPGSISLPKEETPHSYGILENNKFIVKTLDGQEYSSILM